MTMMNVNAAGGAGSWHVGKAGGRCAACGAELAAHVGCWAALCDGGKVVMREAVEGGGKGKKGGDKEAAGAAGGVGGTGGASPFVRVDFCEKCWGEGKRPENLPAAEEGAGKLTMFSFWKTVVPAPQEKKKLLVDDSVLVDVFARMEGKHEPQEVRFRFVLALILMRKRLLKYEGMEENPKSEIRNSTEEGSVTPERVPEVWRMLPRGGGEAVKVVNPHLTAEQITEVSQQLSAILAEEV